MKKIMWLVLAILVIAAVPIVGQESAGDANRFVIPAVLAESEMVQMAFPAIIDQELATDVMLLMPSASSLAIILVTVFLCVVIPLAYYDRSRKARPTGGGFADRLKYPSMIPA